MVPAVFSRPDLHGHDHLWSMGRGASQVACPQGAERSLAVRVEEGARPVTTILPAGATPIDKREVATVSPAQQCQVHLEDQFAFPAEGLQLDAPRNHPVDRPAIGVGRASRSPAHAFPNPDIIPVEQSQNTNAESRGRLLVSSMSTGAAAVWPAHASDFRRASSITRCRTGLTHPSVVLFIIVLAF